MTDFPHILADGIPAPLIFFGFVVLIMVLSSVLGGGKPKETPRVPLGGPRNEAERRRAEMQRRVGTLRDNLARRGAGGPPPLPPELPPQQQTRGRQAKASRKAAARAVTAAAPIIRPPAVQPIAAVVAPIASRETQTEAARNLKLMLQRGGIREAVLLGEVLGPPKSLRDDA